MSKIVKLGAQLLQLVYPTALSETQGTTEGQDVYCNLIFIDV